MCIKRRFSIFLVQHFDSLKASEFVPLYKLQFLALTEEDLNKYDLTQGAKKKLKTQLELQKSAE